MCGWFLAQSNTCVCVPCHLSTPGHPLPDYNHYYNALSFLYPPPTHKCMVYLSKRSQKQKKYTPNNFTYVKFKNM